MILYFDIMSRDNLSPRPAGNTQTISCGASLPPGYTYPDCASVPTLDGATAEKAPARPSTRTEKDVMKLKLDENGHVVVKGGFPIWVAEDGKEIAYDVPKLVGDLSRLNADAAARGKEADGLNAKLRLFEGIDPEKAKAALETVANLDAGKLIDAGKVETLKAEIKKSYDGKVSDLEKALAKSQKDAADKLAARDASIRNLLVKGIFDSSAFLKDKTVLPPDVAYASFGKHFEVKEENGELKVLATLNGQPIYSRANPGTFATPEEALEDIIDKYPMKDRILKTTPGGSGSQGNASYVPGGKVIPKGDMNAFGANLEAIAKGEITVAAR